MKSAKIIGCTIVLFGLSFSACSAEVDTCSPASSENIATQSSIAPLPVKTGPRMQTSGRVPHIQMGFTPVATINDELNRLAFSLPGVQQKPTIVSLPGAIGMWLQDDVQIVNPQAIAAGREFAHIHTDGSLHAPLPFDRALEVAEKGWGERHPWADSRNGWEGFVMLYSASSTEELKVLMQLVTESYNYISGLNVAVPDC